MVGHGVLDQSEEWLERIWKWWGGICIVVVMVVFVVVVVVVLAAMILIIRVIVTIAGAVAVADSVFRVFYPCIGRMFSSGWVVCKMWRWKEASRLRGRR